ncbi:MAG: hypothetical protein QG567_603 [Campylobacterota bacterium]|nr:hypothetical protein [Campylobacterota bacterium]
MAIDLKDFKQTKYPGLYKSIAKDKTKGYKYLMWSKIDGKLHKKIIGCSETDKLTDRQAKDKLEKIKADIEAGYTSSSKITLDKLFDFYFETLDKTKTWTKKQQDIYNLYIRNAIGKKKIDKLREMDIRKILHEMRDRGLKPRTQKTVLEVLKPLFRFAMKNKYLKEDPAAWITVKVPNQKKIVTEATELFKQVYKGIITLYKDEPFYQALFLFGFTGRRKNEILTLKWENIDFSNNYYWIEDTKNDDKQKYELPLFIKDQLLKITDTRRGLVFKSPITGKKILNIDRQMRNLIKHLALTHCSDNPLYQAYTALKAKEKKIEYINNLKWSDRLMGELKTILDRYAGSRKGKIFDSLELEKFDKLSPHYMRNILVSMLAEQKTEAIIMSGILGHKDVNTINKYLSINHFKSSQEGYKKIDEVIDVDFEDVE